MERPHPILLTTYGESQMLIHVAASNLLMQLLHSAFQLSGGFLAIVLCIYLTSNAEYSADNDHIHN